MLANKFGLSQMQLEILVFVTTQGNFWFFCLLLSLEIAFPSLKLTENCYLNTSIFFFLRNNNLIINWVPSLIYKNTVAEGISSQSNKMKSLRLQKSQFLSYLVNWEKSGSAEPRLIFKKFLIFFEFFSF